MVASWRRAGRVHVGDGRRRGERVCDVGEDRADRRGQAAGEERRHVDGQQDVDGRPVAAADRPARTEVVDRLGLQQARVVAVEGDEHGLQVLVEGEHEARAGQGVHVPAERQRPGALRDLVVRRGVAVNGQDLDRGRVSAAAELRTDSRAQMRQEVNELGRTLVVEILVPDEMTERGKGLHVVADVARGLRPARVVVVHDCEGHVGTWLRCRRGVGRAVHPSLDPVAAYDHLLADLRLTGDRGIEDDEDLPGEVGLAGAVHQLEDVHPPPRVHLCRGCGHESPHLEQHGREVVVDARADVRRDGVLRPQVTRKVRELLPGQLGVAAVEGDDAEAQVPHLSGRRILAQVDSHGSRAGQVVSGDPCAHLGDQGSGRRRALRDRARIAQAAHPPRKATYPARHGPHHGPQELRAKTSSRPSRVSQGW